MKAFVLDASLTMEWFGGTPSAWHDPLWRVHLI